MKRYLDHLAIADPEAAQRLQHHLGGIHFEPTLFPMEKAVQEIIEALCVEISFGRTLADGIGRMLVRSTPENLDRYLNEVKTASCQGPTLAGIIAKHLVSVLACKDEGLAEKFEKTTRIMIKKGTYTLKAPLEVLCDLIESKELESAHAFLDLLGSTYALDLSYNRSLYLTHSLPRAVRSFSARRLLWQIRGMSKVIRTDVRLIDDYLQGLVSGLELLSEKELDTFLDQAIRRYRTDPEVGRRFFSLEAQRAKEICREYQVAVPLSAVRSSLERYINARTGQSIPVRGISSLGEKGPADRSNPAMVHCDGQTLYLPEEIDQMDRREDNLNLYKLLTRLEAGAVEFGSYELDAEKAMDVSGVYPTSFSTHQTKNESDLAFFLRAFDQPRIALDLFTIFEHARVAQKIKQQYPGLFKRLQRALGDRELQQRTGCAVGGTCFFFYQHLVINKGGRSESPLEAMVHSMALRFDQATRSDPTPTVEKSVSLTLEFYPPLVDMIKLREGLSYEPLRLPFGRRMEPSLYGPYHQAYYRLSSALKKDLAERKIFVYRSDIQELLTRQKGKLSAIDIRRHFIRESSSPGEGHKVDITDSGLESLMCSYGIGNTATDADGVDAYRYREWDFCMADYLPDHVRVLERRIPVSASTFYTETLNRFPGLVRTIRYAFELLRPEEITILRQWREGDDFDYRALLDYALDKKAGLMPSDRLFLKRMKRVRDVAALLLVDLSKSTANAVDQRGTSVLDVEKQAIVLLCEALGKVGDRFAIAGFSGTGPLGVDYYPVKELNEAVTDTVKGRISAMSPQRSTRMGAAIRHATARLSSVQARVKLIVILGDGFPNDLLYKGTYAVEDTRRAILEARTEGTFVRAITVNAGDNKLLDRLYGVAHHTRISNIHDLPGRLVRVYTALTRH